MGSPYWQNNYIGEFASPTLATAEVVSAGWDVGGEVPDGMWYYDTAYHVPVIRANGEWKILDYRPIGINYKETWFPADPDTTFDNYRVRLVAKNGTWNFNFASPSDYEGLVSIELLAIAGGSLVNDNIAISSSYAAVGEPYSQHQETDSLIVNATSGDIISLDVASVFTNLDSGDICGLHVEHNNIDNNIGYLGVRLRFNS